MPLNLRTYSPVETPQLSDNPLTVAQLDAMADDILAYVERYRPEYVLLCRLQRNCGNRITEMFQPSRWIFPQGVNVQIQPQKGNATRVIPLADLGFTSAAEMAPTIADMARLPKGQYERIFAKAVRDIGLWRLYEGGFLHPSTHFFRHLKIKMLNSQGFDKNFIANYIGEKKISNLDYYLDSQYFAEIR